MLNDLKAPDPVSTRLLAWLYQRRTELGMSAGEIAALEPIYRFTWMKNQRLLNSAMQVARVLQAAGIEVLFLKGLPLLLEVYGDEGARYLEDFDIMIRSADVERSRTVMAQLGYQPAIPETFAPGAFRIRHSCELTHPTAASCDLHWRLLRPPNPAVDEEPLWAGKRKINFRGLTVFAPAVEDCLLQLMVHGMAWESLPPVRWILDARLLLNKHKLDWERFLREAGRRGVLLPVAEALGTYDEILPGEVPAWVCERVSRHSPSASERRAYEQVALPYEEVSMRVAWEMYRSDYELAKALRTVGPGFKGALQHLCRYLRVPSPGDLPRELIERLLKRAGYGRARLS